MKETLELINRMQAEGVISVAKTGENGAAKRKESRSHRLPSSSPWSSTDPSGLNPRLKACSNWQPRASGPTDPEPCCSRPVIVGFVVPAREPIHRLPTTDHRHPPAPKSTACSGTDASQGLFNAGGQRLQIGTFDKADDETGGHLAQVMPSTALL